MMNEKLLKKLVKTGERWVTNERNYSYESRLFFPLEDIQSTQCRFVAIIEVKGFYSDENWTKPIKLHYEKVFSTLDLYNTMLTQEQINNYALSFSEELNILTSKAYEEFEAILKNETEKGEVYSADPFA